MKRLSLFLLLAIVVVAGNVVAQEMSFGFKAGMNVSTITGPSEQDDAGNDLEEFNYNTGFHVGAGMILKFTDRFGLKTEVLFSQKGRRYNYNGQSFQIFTTNDGNELSTTGLRKTTLNVNHSYVEIPVSGYARVLPWLELSGGLYAGIVVGSTGAGEWIYSGTTDGGVTIDEFLINLEHNYFRDQPDDELSLDDAIMFSTGNQTVSVPSSVGAYYDIPRNNGNLYSNFDVGVLGGISIFLNEGLYVGARFTYGFVDMTNNDYDVSRARADGTSYILRDDVDKNISIQFSVGFSF